MIYIVFIITIFNSYKHPIGLMYHNLLNCFLNIRYLVCLQFLAMLKFLRTLGSHLAAFSHNFKERCLYFLSNEK